MIEADVVEGIATWIERRARLIRELGLEHREQGSSADVRRCEDAAIMFDALVAALRTGEWKEPEPE